MSFDLAVSIVVYHTDHETLARAIESVLNSSLRSRLCIVDNSETDAIGRWVEDRYEGIEYIFNDANLGYGKAHNIAIKQSLEEEIPYHLVMNPDVWFDTQVLEKLHSYMEEHEEVGNIMPKVLYGNGEEQYLCKLVPTPMDLIFRRFLLEGSVKEKMKNRYEMRFSGYDKIMEVPILSGCFMFLRSDALKEVGLFDDRYFMYMEDVDLGRRIHRKYKTIFYPKVHIYHGYAKESYTNPLLLKYHIRSAVSYFNKWGWFFDRERSRINRKALQQFDQ